MTLDLSDVQLDALLKRLHLANTRRTWRELTRRAETEEWSYHDFLALLVSEEIAHRQQTRIARMVRRARFPVFKTIDEFNFMQQSTVRLSLLGSSLSADFVTEGRCLIFSGKPGRGKTHLAVAIAYRAIQHGFDALFVTAAELIDDLSAAFRSGRLADALARYVHPAVIVIDEVGYLTYGTDAANMLFHVVNDRHRKKRAMVFTTNKPLTAWGRVLHDEDLAHAIVDRILERGRVLTLDGPSMRTKHLGLDDATSPEASDPAARISGIDRPEFPEPTSIESSGSADVDFGTLLAVRSSRQPSVIQFRGEGSRRPDALARTLLANLPQFVNSLENGCIVTFEPVRLRVRLLPIGPRGDDQQLKLTALRHAAHVSLVPRRHPEAAQVLTLSDAYGEVAERLGPLAKKKCFQPPRGVGRRDPVGAGPAL